MEKGIICASNHHQEWLFNFFYTHLRLHSDLPITFIDLGCTEDGLKFWNKRANIITLNEESYPPLTDHDKSFLGYSYFKKPYCFKLAPYKTNLWLDFDAFVVKSFDHIFDELKDPFEIVIHHENTINTGYDDAGLFKKVIIPLYNSGVVVFKKNTPFIDQWIQACQNYKIPYMGDQDALSFALMQHKTNVKHLEATFNRIPCLKTQILCEPTIVHYAAYTKFEIKPKYDAIFSGLVGHELFKA